MIKKETVLELINNKIEEVAEPFFLVDMKISGSNKIMVELEHEDRKITIDDCIQFSRAIEHNLDREVEDFELEVSSAGMSNPFKVYKQYVKHIGRNVKVLLKNGKAFEAKLTNATPQGVELEYKTKETVEGKKKKVETVHKEQYPFDEINQVKLVITFK